MAEQGRVVREPEVPAVRGLMIESYRPDEDSDVYILGLITAREILLRYGK